MKNLWLYIKKVWKNNNYVYDEVKNALQELAWFLSILFLSVLFLAIPIGRELLKWLAYLFVGTTGIGTCIMAVANIFYLANTYRQHRKMEEAGIPEEEYEKERIRLCKIEGDDGLTPDDFAEAGKETVYFMDYSAMSRYANSLYGCFLAQRFDSKYMKLESNAVFYTTHNELNKLQEAEISQNMPNSPYQGYARFIRVNVRIIPDIPKEQLRCERENGQSDTPTTDDEMNVAYALYLKNAEDVNVIMLSESEEVHELAEYNCMMSQKPFEEVY